MCVIANTKEYRKYMMGLERLGILLHFLFNLYFFFFGPWFSSSCDFGVFMKGGELTSFYLSPPLNLYLKKFFLYNFRLTEKLRLERIPVYLYPDSPNVNILAHLVYQSLSFSHTLTLYMPT